MPERSRGQEASATCGAASGAARAASGAARAASRRAAAVEGARCSALASHENG